MKALVLEACNELRVQEFPDPVPSPGEVLIAVRACGICGSDVHGMDGSTGRRQPPIIMGHEASGEIVAHGAAVNGWQVGERVTFDSTVSCGACDECMRGRVNLCANRRVLGVACDEYRQHGAFAQYLAVPENILHRIPEGLSFEHAALAEPMSVAAHAVGRVTIDPGEPVVLIGTGVIGLLVVQVLRSRGCKRIIVADVDDSRLAIARLCGAETILNSAQEDVPARVHEITRSGARVVFEAVGIEATVDAALRCACKGGSVVLIGNVSPKVGLPLQIAVTRELTLLGSCASAGEYPACLELMASGAVDMRPLISAVAPLEEGAAWFKRLHEREKGLLKVILTPEREPS